jgi:hypothetical protein
MCSVKRVAAELLDDLDTFVQEKQINEHVYMSLCKKLKSLHNSKEDQRKRVQTGVCLDYAMCSPLSLMFAPDEVDQFSHHFMDKLFERHRVTQDGTIKAEWFDEVLDYYLPDAIDDLEIEMVRHMFFLLLNCAPELHTKIASHVFTTVGRDPDDFFDDFDFTHSCISVCPKLICLIPSSMRGGAEDENALVRCAIDFASVDDMKCDAFREVCGLK